jgi:predicted homoserine dehydrogenase-like protein
MSIYQKLFALGESGKAIRIGVIGAGQMGFGMISQLTLIKGIEVRAICSKFGFTAQKAKVAYLNSGLKHHEIFVSKSLKEVINHPDVDIVVDCTGIPDVGAQICLACLEAKKHIVMVNVEMDITIGTLMYNRFKEAGLVYTGSDGDEPACTFELIEFAKAIGFEVLVAGKGKNNKIRLQANPDTVLEEATRRGMAPHMLASFADGTKTMAEMTLLSNATGMIPDIPGMHGTKGNLEDTLHQLRLKSEGGVLNQHGVVEYVDGLAPGVFAIVKSDNPHVVHEINYMMLTQGDQHILYRPFHLGSLETPLTIAKVYFNREFAIAPLCGPISDTVCVAKKDIKAGEILDGIGGYCVRGWIELHKVVREKKLIPIGLIEGNTTAKRDIPNGTLLTEDDVSVDTSTTIYRLRQEQDKIYG